MIIVTRRIPPLKEELFPPTVISTFVCLVTSESGGPVEDKQSTLVCQAKLVKHSL